MVKSANAKLQTNLLGRKIHLLTDEEVREEARRGVPPLDPGLLENLTAESWFPALKRLRQRFGDQVGEIVVVHIEGTYLYYTISFGGQLVQLNAELWRLNASEETNETDFNRTGIPSAPVQPLEGFMSIGATGNHCAFNLVGVFQPDNKNMMQVSFMSDEDKPIHISLTSTNALKLSQRIRDKAYVGPYAEQLLEESGVEVIRSEKN